jgi:predicted metal-dependent HD superfamily phosphohydrolase
VLKQSFINLVENYSGDHQLIETLWDEIEKNYSENTRYYHTLTHLTNMFSQLEEVKAEIVDRHTLLFSLYYHDFIYQTKNNDNEERTAEMARERLQLLSFPPDKIEKCFHQILATKGHLKNNDHDTNLFIDADLSILGQSWLVYTEYASQIRKEYAIYPDSVYKSGREKVLSHFLNMEQIFKTPYFYDKYERKAKENLREELRDLTI